MGGNENSKSKEKRLEEKEKQETELERSLIVAKVKEAHKQIEDTEKLRKRSAAVSICKRIDTFNGNALAALDPMVKTSEAAQLLASENMLSTIEFFERTYASIAYDFQKSLDLTDEAVKNMFPVVRFRKDTVDNIATDLINAVLQAQQMRGYCERLLV